MKKYILIIFCFTSLSSFAQQEIKIDDAKNHVGDSVKFVPKYMEVNILKEIH